MSSAWTDQIGRTWRVSITRADWSSIDRTQRHCYVTFRREGQAYQARCRLVNDETELDDAELAKLLVEAE